MKEGKAMNLSKLVRQSEKGVTLVELLLAITILSVVLLTFTRFFYQAGTYNLSNQNKTVALNVARNAMMYMEKQPFIEVRTDFEPALLDGTKKESYSYKLLICSNRYKHLKKDETPASDCHPPLINSEEYDVIVYPEQMKDPSKRKYYIPVTVEVTWGPDESRKKTELDGTIKSEDLR